MQNLARKILKNYGDECEQFFWCNVKEKLSKQPCIGKISHYQQCLLHLMKIHQVDKYFRRQQITYIKERIESFDSEIKDYLTPTQLIMYARLSCHMN